jgi:cell division protein FtsB
MNFGKLHINFKQLGIFLALATLVFLAMDFNSRMEELARLNKQAATVQAEATAVRVTQRALQTAQAEATSAVAVDEYAREQAHMAKPGDIVVVPIPAPGSLPPPSPTPAVQAPQLSNWDLWILYLFGNEP